MAGPMIHLLCGLPGSGKTTLARQLEADLPALVLSEDEWVSRLFPPEAAHSDKVRMRVKHLQWAIGVRTVRIGRDVVLDWGAWSRKERDIFRARAAADRVPLRFHYLDVPFDELLRRIERRNADLPPATYHVTEADLRRWLRWFEPPTADELREPDAVGPPSSP